MNAKALQRSRVIVFIFYILILVGLSGLMSVVIWTEPGPINGTQLLYCLFGQAGVLGLAGFLGFMPYFYILKD